MSLSWESQLKPYEREAGLLEAGVAALLHADADGVQAQQRVGQVGRPLLRLRPRKLQDRQRLAQRLQPVSPAVDARIASDPPPQQSSLCSSLHASQKLAVLCCAATHTTQMLSAAGLEPFPNDVGLLHRHDDMHTFSKPAMFQGPPNAQTCKERVWSDEELTCRARSCEAWFLQQSRQPRLGQLPVTSPWAPQRPPGPA